MNFNTKKSIKAKDLIINLIFFMLFSLFNTSIAGLEGNEIPISTKEYNQQNPAVVYLPDKSLWFVVWEDDRNTNTTGNDIYGLFIKSDGTLCGNELQITTDAGNQTYPSVTYDKTNQRLVIAWQDTRGNTTGGYIYYNYIDVSAINTADCSGYIFNTANENPVGFTSISGDSLISRQKPKINYDPINNQYWIVFLESRSTQHLVAADCFGLGIHNYRVGDTTFIGYAIVDNTLSVVNTDIIRNSPAGVSLKSRLISSSHTEFEEVYTFEFFTNVDNPVIGIDTTTNQQLFVYEGVRHLAKLTCSCTDLDGNNTCNAGDTIASTLKFEPDPENGIKHIYGIWNVEIPGSTNHKYIDATLTTPSYNPHLAFDYTSKRFLVVWENIGDSGNTKIYGQLISSGTGLYNTNILISYQDVDGDGNQDDNIANSKQTKPYVEYDPVNQRFFIIWQDGRNGTVSTENLDIYGQYVDSEGSLRGNNYIINTQAFNQRDPVLAFNNSSQQYLAVWKDARKANDSTCGTGTQPCGSDIYGQRFSIGQPQLTLLKSDNTILSPALIDFGDLFVNGNSSEFTFYIKNTGDSELTIDCISEKNTTLIPSVFEFSSLPTELSACDGTTLTLFPNTSIPIGIIFHPTSEQLYKMTLTVTSNASQPIEIYVQGRGVSTGGSLEISQTSLDFGSVVVGSSSTLKITLTNRGNGNLTINQIPSIPAGYSITLGTTPISAGTPINQAIPAGTSIDLYITFSPTTESIYTGSITIDTDYNDISISLSGTGVVSSIAVNPTSIDFGSLVTNSALDRVITIENTGLVDVTISSISGVSDPFSIVTTLTYPLTLAPNEKISVTVRFAPSTYGNYNQNMIINTDIGDRTVTLSGIGLAADVSVDKSNLDFDNVPVGSTSTAQTITISNRGTSDLSIKGCSFSDPAFTYDSGFSCPTTVAAGNSTTINIVFKPTEVKNYSGNFVIETEVGNVTVALSGKGQGGVASVDNTVLQFGSVVVGNSSTLKVTLTNTGDADLTINQILSIPAGYTVTLGSTTVTAGNPINQIIPSDSSIYLFVTFNPNTEGIYTGSFTIDTDYNDVVINLSGTGVIPDISITAPAGLNFGDTLDFGNVQIGTSYTKMIKIKNNSYIPVNLNVINNPLDKFTIGDISLPYTLQPGATLDVYITFTPTDTTSVNTSVGFLFDGDTEPRKIFLTGQGVDAVSSTGTFKLQDLDNNDINLINFGKVFKDDLKEVQLKIVNTSSVNTLTINRVTLSNQTDFDPPIGLNTPFTLNPNESKEFKVVVRPSTLGTITGTLTIEDNSGATLSVDLIAEGTDFEVSTDTGTVIDFVKLPSIPYPDAKPSNFSAYGAYRFIINTGDSTNPKTIKASVTLTSLPPNLTVYKVKNDGTWTKITNIVVSGKTITYSIEDNGTLDLDSRTGIIEDPIVIGSETTTSTDTLTNGGTTTFPEISGGGGCSFGSNTDYSISAILIILLIMVLRVFNMRKTAIAGLFAAIGIFISSCGTGPGSDVGNSVYIDILSIDPNYIQADIVDRKDYNNDNVCDDYVIPASNVTVNVTFKSVPIKGNITPSDVTFTKYTVEYYPANAASPGLEAKVYPTACTVQPETETICSFVVASQDLKEDFYTRKLTGSYNIKLIIEGSEVLYDKDIKVEVGAHVIFDQFIGDNDDQCI